MTNATGPTRRQALLMAAGASAAASLPHMAFARERLDLLVAYYGALINTAPVAVGMQKGFYSTANVEVSDVVSTIGGGTAIRNMIGGGLEYGIVGTSAALTAIREGIDVQIVHGVIRTMEDLFWVSMPGSGITSIQDLKGKKIGFTRPRSISETMARWMLERNGMSGQAELVALGGVGAGLSALESGGVDAALILEPLWSARQGRYQIAFTLEELPPMTQMVGVATRRMMDTKPDVLRDLVAGWTQSVNFTYENHAEASQIMSDAFGAQTLPPYVALSAVSNMAGIDYWSRGDIDIPGLEFWLQTMREQGEWEGEAHWDRMINEAFLPEALRS